MKNLQKRILVSITGSKQSDWKSKLDEIVKYRIKKIALFLEMFSKNQRNKIYKALLSSNIKRIPLVHLKNGMGKEELKFLKTNFNTKYFTIHESSFKNIEEWEGFYKRLFLEMNKDNKISKEVDVKKIGGFCIDLSHFKVEEKSWSKEFLYIIKREGVHRYFKCNHLNGYNCKTNSDLHTVTNLKQFSYLKTLPDFLFGKYIALETFNSIEEQLIFKKYIIKLLEDK